MYRIHPDTGEILVPHVFDDGSFGAADPANGSKRHHIANRVPVNGVEGLRECVRKGWPIWMSIRGTRDRRLVSKGIVDAAAPGEPAAAPAPRPARPARAVQEPVPAPPAHTFPASPVEAGTEAKEFLSIIAALSDREIDQELERPRRLLVATHRHGGKLLEMAYAPFDHVNVGAKVVIVGITPGRQQMKEAVAEARRAAAAGLPDGEVLARAKVHASFAGQMRSNLVKLMDAVGLNDMLGIATTASLWGADSHLAHFTSALRYPTFADGKDYNRSPDLNDVPFLFGKARAWLKEELAQVPDAVIVPMGDMIAEVLTRIGREMSVPAERLLSSMPHASPSNNGRISSFLGAKGESDPMRRRFRETVAKVEALSTAPFRP